ncbi:hypothetical protein ABZ671_01140 [Micromonospora sp. NPDC006766]|uniref:hypothetical protein n=1 Tax=Micromonospora sp. NPDC006766 TaxID=3154778 RepID=UPI0033DDE9CB
MTTKYQTRAAKSAECDECGEYHPADVPCRTPQEILAECAPPPPADYTAQFRAARAASFARLDATLRGVPAAGLTVATAAKRRCKCGKLMNPEDVGEVRTGLFESERDGVCIACHPIAPSADTIARRATR